MVRLRFLLKTLDEALKDGDVKCNSLEIAPIQHVISFTDNQLPHPLPVGFKPISFSAQAVPGESVAKTLLRELVINPDNLYKLNKLVKTYNLSRGVSWLFKDIQELHKLKPSTKLFDQFTQEGGNDVTAWFIRPECAIRHPELHAKATLFPTQELIDQLTELDMYAQAAHLSVPATVPEDSIPEASYSTLQNDTYTWREDDHIFRLTENCRSAQVGDVFVIGSYGYVVKGIGFERLTGGFWPREPVADEVAKEVGENEPDPF